MVFSEILWNSVSCKKKKKRFPRYGAGYISHISLNYAARISAIIFTVNNSSISSNIYMNDNLYPNKIIW